MWCGCPAWATGTELKQKIILILVQFGLPSKLFSHKSQNRSGYILIRVKPAPNNQPDRVAIKEKIHLNLIIPSHTHTQDITIPAAAKSFTSSSAATKSFTFFCWFNSHTQLTYTTILRRTMTTNTTTTKMAPASPEGCEQPVDGV